MSSEFDIIKRYFTRDMSRHDTVVLGVGDDAAIIQPTPNTELVVTLDTMVEGVHFADNEDPYDIGYKLAAVNLSDLAAMGAEPRWATLALTLAEIDEDWLGSFADGLYCMLDEFSVALVGGDTTAGSLTLSLQLAGEVPQGQALRRQGAKPGDRVYVSGTLGDAGLALRVREGLLELEELEETFVEERLCRPTPQLQLGQALRGIASSAIDISDGLLADLGHITAASSVGADIRLARLPLSGVTSKYLQDDWSIVLASGDDYELCFTAPLARHDQVMQLAGELGVAIAAVGEIVSAAGVRCWQEDGSEYHCEARGYEHFVEEQ